MQWRWREVTAYRHLVHLAQGFVDGPGGAGALGQHAHIARTYVEDRAALTEIVADAVMVGCAGKW